MDGHQNARLTPRCRELLLRTCLRHLRAAHQCTAALATRLQLAPTPCQLGRSTSNLQTRPQQEQPVETPHLGDRVTSRIRKPVVSESA